jgi:phosphoglycerate dehydrogenase-like enzyme
MGMSVVGHDPFLPAETPLDGLAVERLDSLEAALARADVVSLHLAASEATKGMVDATFFGALRPGALFVNVARGELVDEEALLVALDSGTLGGAALDVRFVEPPGPSALADHPRVVSTPHIAGITVAAQERVVDMIAADIGRVLAGEDARHAVGHHWRRR